MKVLTFLALSAFTVTTTTVYAEHFSENDKAHLRLQTVSTNENSSENAKNRPLLSRPAQKDLLALPSLKTAKKAMRAKKLLSADFKKLRNAQRKQRIAEEKERQENQKKIKMIESLPAKGIDTLNVAQFMKVLFWYPEANHKKLEKAIKFKTDALYAEKKPRKYLKDAERKAEYISALDAMFSEVNQDAKRWKLDGYGYRQVVTLSRPAVEEVIFEAPKAQESQLAKNIGTPKPQKRQFAKKMKVWTKKTRAAVAAVA